MSSYKVIIPCVVFIMLSYVESAKILAVFPVPSVSHQSVFRAYTHELAVRGHEIVVLTPLLSPKEKLHENIEEIHTAVPENLLSILENENIITYKRGIVANMDPDALTKLYTFITQIMARQFSTSKIKQFIVNELEKQNNFDLVVVEGFLEFPLLFSHIFKVPTIILSSFYGFPELYDAVGSTSRHPIFYPHLQRTKFRNLTLWERIKETYTEYKLYDSAKKVESVQNEELKKYFGDNAPTVNELNNRIHLVLLNALPIFTNNRPMPPNVIFLNGLHLKPVKSLPQELQQFLDNSSRGVVYVSLGSDAQSSQMTEDLLDTFLGAFEKLPFDILWKFDGENLQVPKNVRIEKWYPQRDLLTHPKIKVFVTQGGLQSFDEALDAGVPLVGLPLDNDQWLNVNKFVELGIGVQVDVVTMTCQDLYNAVKTVAQNASYRQNMIKLRSISHDQPLSPIERAMFWTEHVLRQGGAVHLRAATANVHWTEYWMVDVLAIIVGALLLLTFLVYVTCRLIISRLFDSKTRKLKYN